MAGVTIKRSSERPVQVHVNPDVYQGFGLATILILASHRISEVSVAEDHWKDELLLSELLIDLGNLRPPMLSATRRHPPPWKKRLPQHDSGVPVQVVWLHARNTRHSFTIQSRTE